MKINKKYKPDLCVSDDPMRFILQNVIVTRECAVATDGRLLVAVPCERSEGDGTADEPDAVPMGAWLRLRADVDLSGAPAAVQVVGDALRRHGMLLGDTGGTADALHLKLEKREVWQDASGADVARILTDLGPWITAGDLEVIDPTSIRAEDGGAYGGAFAIR